MEMEMDKFLAKKSAIFNKIIFQNQFVDHAERSSDLIRDQVQDSKGQIDDQPERDTSLEFYMVKSIIHLLLKSTYELTRQSRILYPKMYNQFQADMYYLYLSTVFLSFYLFSGNYQADFDD